MPVIICPICKKERYIKPSHIGKAFTCGSKECRSQRMWENIKEKYQNRLGEPLEPAIYRMYVTERRSYRYICKILDTQNRIVMKLLKDFGIEPRRGSEAIKTQWENNPERRKRAAETLQQSVRTYLANGGIPTSQLAQLPEARKKVSEAKKRENWMRGRTGAKNPNWRGGKIWWRGKEWDDLKKKMRERDGNKCRRCGRTNEENILLFRGPLPVHHIVPYRLSRDNNPNNLKTLCNICHNKEEWAFRWLL